MNLLLTGAWQDAACQIPALEAMGCRAVLLRQESDPLPCDPEWVEGTVCNGLFLHHPIGGFPRLRYVQLTSAGTDRVDMDAIRRKAIVLRTARGVYSLPMAEFALSGVLQLYKQAEFFRANQQARRWEKHRGLRELSGSRVLILGCGSVGRAVAERFSAMGCRVTGADLDPAPRPGFEAVYPVSGLDRLLPEQDVVILTLPLTDGTRGILNEARLGLMKPDAIVVNIARGPVVDQAALTAALMSGRLGGAVLDVFEQEPLPQSSPLWSLPGVLLTPHNSFVGNGNAARLTGTVLDNLRAYLTAEKQKML